MKRNIFLFKKESSYVKIVRIFCKLKLFIYVLITYSIILSGYFISNKYDTRVIYLWDVWQGVDKCTTIEVTLRIGILHRDDI